MKPFVSRRPFGQALAILATALIFLGVFGFLQLAAQPLQPPTAGNTLAPGAVATGTVKNSIGDLWAFRGCADTAITVTMRSTAFTPFVELRDGAGVPLPDSATATDTGAITATVQLTQSADYQLLASGDRRTDRGPYTVALAASGLIPAFTADGAVAPGSEVTGSVKSRAGQVWSLYGCAGDVVTVTMTSAAFAPFLELHTDPAADPVASAGDADDGSTDGVATLAAFTFDVTGAVQIIAGGTTSRDRGDYTLAVTASAPAGDNVAVGGATNGSPRPPTATPVPPTATATPARSTPTPRPTATSRATATPSPTPSPTLPALVGLPVTGPGGIYSVKIKTEPGMIVDFEGKSPVFRDRIYFRADISGPPSPVDHVDFALSTFQGEFARHRENTVAYCSFGGGEPNCNTFDIKRGANWPESNTPVCNGHYTLAVDVFLQGQSDPDTWELPFVVNSPNLDCDADSFTSGNSGGDTNNTGGNSGGDTATPTPAAIVAEITHTGPGNQDSALSDAIEFRVDAYDPNVGSNPGDGIANVHMQIISPSGAVVAERTEGTSGYCIFGGGEPDCNIYYFADHDSQWPNGDPVASGTYELRATVNAKRGASTTLSTTVDIP